MCLGRNRSPSKSKKLEADGDVQSGSVAATKKLWRFAKYEPVKYVNSLDNAMKRGAGLSLDEHLPRPSAPAVPTKGALEDKGALICLGDMEGRQSLDLKLVQGVKVERRSKRERGSQRQR